MSNRIDGKEVRIQDLQEAQEGRARERRVSITRTEVLAMIDRVIASYGLDPAKFIDPQGWRHLVKGSAECQVGVVAWPTKEPYLVVFSPVLELPARPTQLGDFYRILLDLNHAATRSAHFSVHGQTLFLAITRPIRGLDEAEVDDAIQSLLWVADGLDDTLEELLGRLPPAMAKLPDIKLRPKEAIAIGACLAYADPHAQSIFRLVMEGWHRKGHIVDPTGNGIALRSVVGEKQYGLANLAPVAVEGAATIILGWQALHRMQVFPAEAIEIFQAAVSGLTDLSYTESTAHLSLTEAFGQDAAKALVQELDRLAQSGDPSRDIEVAFEWDPEIPKIQLALGNAHMHRIQETLKRCEPRVRELFARLIQGWADTAGTVECRRPGRIYLKLKTAEHEYGKYGVVSHEFNLAALASPKGKRGPAIDLQWNLARGDYAYLDYAAEAVGEYEKRLSAQPGFSQEGTTTALEVDSAFEMEHAEELLEAMVKLKEAAATVN